MRILVSGSLAYDRIMDFPGKFADHILPEKIHILNVCFMVNGLQERFGGTAGNIAYNLSLLGERPQILATAGKDFERYGKWLEKLGLPLSGIRPIPEEFTAGAYITTDKADNQITGFNPGAMKYPSRFAFSDIDSGDALGIIAPGNLEDMLAYSRQFKELQVPYIFDPGQSIPALSPEALIEMMTGSKLLICNDYELEMIKKPTRLEKNDILERTEALITTLGEKGSQVSRRGEEIDIPPARPREVVDPTGAGDAYRAGLIKGLAMGRELVTAAQMGSTCASFSVECLGTQEHVFSEDEFWMRFKESFGQV
jgi:adenosine kinase